MKRKNLFYNIKKINMEKENEQIIISRIKIEEEFSQIIDIIKNISTNIWRIRKKILEEEKKDKSKYIEILRHIESTWDILNQNGFEIKDYTGEKYDDGMSLKVISFQPMTNINYKIVNETIKPTIFYKNIIVQTGEVIIAQPMEQPSNFDNKEIKEKQIKIKGEENEKKHN